MDYLIDTHILIWFTEGSNKLSKNHADIITNPKNVIYVSSVTLWEIAIKSSLNKLDLAFPFNELQNQLHSHGFVVLNQDFEDLKTLTLLPFHHGDPFDRLIISQAITKNINLIAQDSKFSYYEEQGLKLIK
ncbi:type II toxin-antitoxin system VapC family toxin [Bernardetia sp. OM2101]|uniref:type II toxin-antitoxin system VapC family toxin n=1 Tax=Bernardetia sp. OM2101 TaxID=3344876 RepID=UPI0035CEDC67